MRGEGLSKERLRSNRESQESTSPSGRGEAGEIDAEAKAEAAFFIKRHHVIKPSVKRGLFLLFARIMASPIVRLLKIA